MFAPGTYLRCLEVFEMKRCAAILIVLGAASWVPAELTETIDSFEDAFVGGPVGPLPSGWTFFGYGPPAWSKVETGIVSDGGQAYRYNLPIPSIAGSSGDYDGQHAILKKTTIDALVSRPIDWTQPVTISIDIYANDTTLGGKWLTLLDFSGVEADRTHASIEWGDNGAANEQWQTAYIILQSSAQDHEGFLYPLLGRAREAHVVDGLRVTDPAMATLCGWPSLRAATVVRTHRRQRRRRPLSTAPG